MCTTREEEAKDEVSYIFQREQLIWESLPPEIGTERCREDVCDECEERTVDPLCYWSMSSDEIYDILREDESEDREEREGDDITSGEVEVLPSESDAHEMLGGFFEEGCYEEREWECDCECECWE